MTDCARIARGALLAAALVFGITPQLAAAGQCHGVAMPPRIEIGGKPLVLNGMGTREATMLKVNVYVAGLYLAAPSRDGASVLRAMDTMRIMLKLMRNVERGQMTDALQDGLKRNAGSQMAALQARADRLEQLIPDLREGDTIAFTYLPQSPGWLVVQVNGQERGRIAGADFARTFFAIWLNNPPNADLKRGLLGGECK